MVVLSMETYDGMASRITTPVVSTTLFRILFTDTRTWGLPTRVSHT